MSTALSRYEPLSGDEWTRTIEQAKVFVRSGLLPQSIKTAEAAIVIMLKGRELGIPPLQACANIVVVKGKPSCMSELMMALVKRDLGRDALRVIETTNDHCTLEYQDGSHTGQFTFSADDAKKAGMWGQPGPWTQYPAAMLRARAISACCRFVFPDVIGGMHSPEELGSAVDVDEYGSMTIIEAPEHPPAPRLAAMPALVAPAETDPDDLLDEYAEQPSTIHAMTATGEQLSDGAKVLRDDLQPEPTGIQNVSDFWAKAKADLKYGPSEVLSAFRRPVAQYVKAHDITWAALYVLLENYVRDGVPIPDTESALHQKPVPAFAG